jgi:hypothetical protein
MLPISGRPRTSTCARSWIPRRMSGKVADATLPAGTPIRTSTESAAPGATGEPETASEGTGGRRSKAGRDRLRQEADNCGVVESMKTGVNDPLHPAAATRRKVV